MWACNKTFIPPKGVTFSTASRGTSGQEGTPPVEVLVGGGPSGSCACAIVGGGLADTRATITATVRNRAAWSFSHQFTIQGLRPWPLLVLTGHWPLYGWGGVQLDLFLTYAFLVHREMLIFFLIFSRPLLFLCLSNIFSSITNFPPYFLLLLPISYFCYKVYKLILKHPWYKWQIFCYFLLFGGNVLNLKTHSTPSHLWSSVFSPPMKSQKFVGSVLIKVVTFEIS